MHPYSYTVLVVNNRISFAKLSNCSLVTKILLSVPFFPLCHILYQEAPFEAQVICEMKSFTNCGFYSLSVFCGMILCYFIPREVLVEKPGEQ